MAFDENTIQNLLNRFSQQRLSGRILPPPAAPPDFRGPMPMRPEAEMPAFAAQDFGQGPMTSEQMMQQSGANTIPGPQFTEPPPVDPRLLSYLRMQQPLPRRPSPDFEPAPSDPSLQSIPQQGLEGIPNIGGGSVAGHPYQLRMEQLPPPQVGYDQEFGTPRIPDSMNERIDPNIGGAMTGAGLGAAFGQQGNRVQEWMQANPRLALGMLHGGAMGGAVGGFTAGPVGAAAGAALGATGLPAGIQLSDRMKEYLNRQ